MTCTSAAEDTSARAASCGTQPAQCASDGAAAAVATAAMPPICTMHMSGTAAKLNSSPASVTREKKSGPSGSSATSAAADAASSAVTGRSARGPGTAAGEHRDADDDRDRGAEGEEERRVHEPERVGSEDERCGECQRARRRGALIDQPCSQVHHRHGRRPRHGAAAASELGVREQHENGQRKPGSPRHEQHAARRQQAAGEDRDVAARDGDDVIGARRLQIALDAVVEAGPVADQDGRDNRRGGSIPGADACCDQLTDPEARECRLLLEPRPAPEHLHECCTLHRSHERRTPARERQGQVRNAGVEVPRRFSHQGLHAHSSSGAPLRRMRRRERAQDGQHRAAVYAQPSGGAPELFDVDDDADALRQQRRILAQSPDDGDDLFVAARAPSGMRDAGRRRGRGPCGASERGPTQWRRVGQAIGVRPERCARREPAGQHPPEHGARVACPVRTQCKGGRCGQCKSGKRRWKSERNAARDSGDKRAHGPGKRVRHVWLRARRLTDARTHARTQHSSWSSRQGADSAIRRAPDDS